VAVEAVVVVVVVAGAEAEAEEVVEVKRGMAVGAVG